MASDGNNIPPPPPLLGPSTSGLSIQKKYTAAFKLKVVEDAAMTSGEASARKHQVNPRRIREWKKQVELLSEFFSINLLLGL